MFEDKVNMYTYEEMVNGRKLTEIINNDHENIKYLPGYKLPENVVSIFPFSDFVYLRKNVNYRQMEQLIETQNFVVYIVTRDKTFNPNHSKVWTLLPICLLKLYLIVHEDHRFMVSILHQNCTHVVG